MKDKRPLVLIVDDDESMRDTLEAILKRDYLILKATNGETALQIIEEKEVRVVLLDIMMPGINGIDVLEQIKDRYEDIEVIMITVLKDVNTAVKAMKLGAYDYITKEFDYDEVLNLVHRIIEKQNLKKEVIYLQSEIERYIEDDFIIGKSEIMRKIYDVIQKVAKLPATILITGESGTGKELLARIIHKESERVDKPFITVDLASIPKELIESTLFGHEKGAFTGAHRQHFGKFELAHGGTIVLDEIGELRYDLQAKLLRVLQEGEIERVGGSKAISVDVRIIAATNKELEKAIKRGEFREDLYYRLNVIPIKSPPLRERREDIPQLARFFITRYNKRFKKNITDISDPALEVLSTYHWPGNIRELENLIERLVATVEGKIISQEHIPMEYYFPYLISEERIVHEDHLNKACEIFERNFILRTLERAKWNRKKTAKMLGIALSTLKNKLNKLNIYESIGKRKRGEKN